MTGEGSVPTEPSITLHSSWFGIVSASLGALIVDALAVAVLVANGVTVVSVLFVLAGIGATLVVVFDMPIATRFEPHAFERLTLLRRQRVDFDDIDRFSRMRRAVRRPGAGPSASASGLVAMRGRRQTLLVDRAEGFVEHQRLREVVGREAAEYLLADVAEPPMNRTPTWVGRRKQWRPDSAS